MNNEKIEQNVERAYRYLKGLGCNKEDINKIASELILYNSQKTNKPKQLPKGFKKGKCKCGNSYGYCGIDIGYCVKCIDKMESPKS